LITHNHHDHFCLESLLRLRHRVECLVVPRSFGMSYGDLSLKLLARKLGFKNVVELDSLESIPLPDGEIFAIPFLGEHADFPHGKSAYVVRTGKEQTLFAADSDCLDTSMYDNIREILGPIQNVFIGMECVGAPLTWSCGTFLPQRPEYGIEQSRRYKGCDARRALSILKSIKATRTFLYAMGLEPWLEYMLGLALTKDSLQIKESTRLLELVRQTGMAEARLLNGPCDILLDATGPDGKRKKVGFRAGNQSGWVASSTGRTKEKKGYPLSYEQQVIWQSHRGDQYASCSFISASFQLDGNLDVVALIRALNEITNRHDILRVRFRTVGGRPRQFVSEHEPILLRSEDLQQYSIEQRNRLALEMIERGTEKPFDLCNGPLFRACLVDLAEDKHLLIVEMHPIVGDDLSLDLLMGEIVSLYKAFAKGEPSPLPAPAQSYFDYVNFSGKRNGLGWQAAKVESRKTKSGATGLQDQQRAAHPVTQGPQANVRLLIPRRVWGEVKRLCRQQQTEIFSLLLPPFTWLLHLLKGESDIRVGWHVFDRSDFDRSGVIGCFYRLAVARISLSGIATFKELICNDPDKAVGKTNYKAFGNMIDEVSPGIGNDPGPLLDGWIEFEGLKGQVLDLKDLKITRVRAESISCPSDLCLSIYDRGTWASGKLSYNPDVFETSLVAELSRRYCALLEEMTHGQERSSAADTEMRPDTLLQIEKPLEDVEGQFLFD
jgi:Condensation domain